MKNFMDLIGRKFGKLTVSKYIGRDKCGDSIWLCKCDCGKEKNIVTRSLKDKQTKSCGCLLKKSTSKIGKLNKTHEYSYSRIYRIWASMVQRCNNPNSRNYKNYGGRGITVCKRWLKFENFLEDVGEPPNDKYQIDRKNNNKGYKPSNCRWISSKENNRNRRNNKLYTYNNKTQCSSGWAEEYNIKPATLRDRINAGLSMEKALITPTRKYTKNKILSRVKL